MNIRARGLRIKVGITLLAAFCCLPVVATDPPDSAINPRSGLVEIVDAALDQEGEFFVRHVIDPGSGIARSTHFITYDTDMDPSPRLCINEDGDTWVAWQMSYPDPVIRLVKHDYTAGTWGEELDLDDWYDWHLNPEIVHDGADLWVAYEAYVVLISSEEPYTKIMAQAIHDGPDPIIGGPHTLAVTEWTGDHDVLINYESEHLWVTWIDSETEIGWSEYDYATENWSPAEYEPYGTDDPETVRARIAEVVLSVAESRS
jgi:hypothetical protein